MILSQAIVFFLNMALKPQDRKAKVNKLDIIKNKNFYSVSEIIQKVKWWPTE